MCVLRPFLLGAYVLAIAVLSINVPVRADDSTETLSVVLGPADAMYLLEESAAIVSSSPSTITLTQRAQVLENLHRAGSYMKILSDEARVKVPIAWTYLGRKRVAAGASDLDSFPVADEFPKVTALRFRASFRDIQVIEVTLLDTSGKSTSIPYNKWVSASLPKHEVLYLDAPVDLKEVILKMHRTAGRSPRMTLDAGECSRVDYARQAWRACEKARGAMERGEMGTLREEIGAAIGAVKMLEGAWGK